MTGFRCLALETSAGGGSVAACSGDQAAAVSLPDTQGSSRNIFKAIRNVLAELSLVPGDLDCIAFGCGPGSFTGVRVATSAAQGLAYALQRPVCRVSSLSALAVGAFAAHGPCRIAVCVDARMGEVYTGLYSVMATGEVHALAEDSICAPENYRLQSKESGWLAAGNGWAVYPALHEHNRAFIAATDTMLVPLATGVLQLAMAQAKADIPWLTASEALPHYVRDKVTG